MEFSHSSSSGPSNPNNKRSATGDISPINNKKTNAFISEANNGNSVTPNEDLCNGDARERHTSSYYPSHIQEHLVRSSVYWRWYEKEGKKLDQDLLKAVTEDRTKRRATGPNKSRKIDLSLLANVLWSLLSFLYLPQRKRKSMCTALVQCLFQVLVVKHPEYFTQILLEESTKYLRSQVFLAYKFQRTIDMHATGGLNYESCNSIRSGVEELAKGKQGIIPCGTTISRSAKELEKHAAEEHGLAIQTSMTQHGLVFSFEINNVIRQIVKQFGLEEYTRTGSSAKPVMLTYTLDGAQLTNELGHLTGGIKIVDPRAIDPSTGIPIAISGKFQSRDLCFVLQLAFMKDSKSAYKDCFADFFTTFNNGKLVIPATDMEPELSNFEVNSCQDLSSGWKSTKLGGGCKTTNLFCCYCMVARGTECRYKMNHDRCDLCTRLGNERCFCHDVSDEGVLEGTKKRLAEYIEEALDDGYQRLDFIQKNTQMLFDENVTDKENMTNHIDYEPVSADDRKRFLNMMNLEIRIRFKGRDLADKGRRMIALPMDEKRVALKELAICEASINIARKTVTRHEQARSLAVALAAEKLIPCILHMKMRVCEKIFHCLVNDALDRYGDSSVDSKKRKSCAEKVEKCMQKTVFGNEPRGRVSQWKFRWVKPGNVFMDKASFSGAMATKLCEGLKSLSDMLFANEMDQESMSVEQGLVNRQSNEDKRLLWHKFADIVVPMWELIEQHDDYTDLQINELHKLTNKFVSIWIDLTGSEHMTNYIHILGSGHLTYFASCYRNLYCFSQQGWESLNQLLKHYYFNNTNHGGSSGNGGKDVSGIYSNATESGDHCRPLMRLCQRSMMWKLGYGDAYFENKHYKKSTDEETEDVNLEFGIL